MAMAGSIVHRIGARDAATRERIGRTLESTSRRSSSGSVYLGTAERRVSWLRMGGSAPKGGGTRRQKRANVVGPKKLDQLQKAASFCGKHRCMGMGMDVSRPPSKGVGPCSNLSPLILIFTLRARVTVDRTGGFTKPLKGCLIQTSTTEHVPLRHRNSVPIRRLRGRVTVEGDQQTLLCLVRDIKRLLNPAKGNQVLGVPSSNLQLCFSSAGARWYTFFNIEAIYSWQEYAGIRHE